VEVADERFVMEPDSTVGKDEDKRENVKLESQLAAGDFVAHPGSPLAHIICRHFRLAIGYQLVWVSIKNKSLSPFGNHHRRSRGSKTQKGGGNVHPRSHG
jgi:hypothetical protein